jgi:hypothetical protein
MPIEIPRLYWQGIPDEGSTGAREHHRKQSNSDENMNNNRSLILTNRPGNFGAAPLLRLAALCDDEYYEVNLRRELARDRSRAGG